MGEKIQIHNLINSSVFMPMQETQVQFLSLEDPLEKEVATHSSIIAWEVPWTEEPGCVQSMGSQKSQTQLSDENKHIYRLRA